MPAASHTIDMTAYINGIHTIYWVVSDDAGNIDGIGSRFFTVQLAGNVQAQAGGMRYRSLTSNGKELKNVPVDYSAAVGVKRGFAFNSEVQNVYPDNHGVHAIEIKELERIVIQLGNNQAKVTNCAGYLTVGKSCRALPTGSTLDASEGIFYWLPGPGFLGEYRLTFVMQAGLRITRKDILITVRPKH